MSTTPEWGVIGLPAGLKEAGKRVDFKVRDFDFLIETKGYRVAWTRALPCPCAPISDQTRKPDPNCEICDGIGWTYFGLSTPQSESLIGELDVIQQAIVDESNAAVIRAIMTRLEQDQNPNDPVSHWVSGSLLCTVRHQNKLGYYDRIVNLDSEIVYSELRDADGEDELRLRYLATGINQLRSETTIYQPTIDYDLDVGIVKWRTGKAPTEGTRISVHYLCHPTWLVMDWPHIIRTTSLKFKTATNVTPQGDPAPLPIQATLRYEFVL